MSRKRKLVLVALLVSLVSSALSAKAGGWCIKCMEIRPGISECGVTQCP